MKGPGIFLAQFMADEAPFDKFGTACKWAANLGYIGVQLPAWDDRCMDIKKCAESKGYAEELNGIAKENGVEITEISTHLQGQLVAVNPAFDIMFDGFAPDEVHGNPKARTEWAIQQMMYAANAAKNLGVKVVPTFSGALLWHTLYPWPQRPEGLVEEGFRELASRWKPILNEFDKVGVDLAYEIHPGEDLHDGVTFERFLEAVGNHPRCNMLYDPSHFVIQHLDYCGYIDAYHQFIKAFHVKDAEFNASAKSGVYGGYQSWTDRPGRFRSTGDGQVDFTRIFSKFAQYKYEGWATIEWECCIKDSEQGAREGSVFVRDHMIEAAKKAFDDFAGSGADTKTNRSILGLS